MSFYKGVEETVSSREKNIRYQVSYSILYRTNPRFHTLQHSPTCQHRCYLKSVTLFLMMILSNTSLSLITSPNCSRKCFLSSTSCCIQCLHNLLSSSKAIFFSPLLTPPSLLPQLYPSTSMHWNSLIPSYAYAFQLLFTILIAPLSCRTSQSHMLTIFPNLLHSHSPIPNHLDCAENLTHSILPLSSRASSITDNQSAITTSAKFQPVKAIICVSLQVCTVL